MRTRKWMIALCIVTLLVFILIGCRSSAPVPKTAEELEFGRLAVREMMELTATASAGNIARADGWRGNTGDLVPDQASPILQRAEDIPGIPLLLKRYVERMNEAVVSICSRLPAYLSTELLPRLAIVDPYALIEGDEDAVTRFFATHASLDIEQWIDSQLRSEFGAQALSAWAAVQRTYNTFNRSQAQIRPGYDGFDGVELDIDPVRTVVISILRQLLADMRSQEALVRTMAPAYDNQLITLFTPR